jgi:hypothetical protein
MDGSIGAGFAGIESTGTIDASGASFQAASDLPAPPPCDLPPAKTRAGRDKTKILRTLIGRIFLIKIPPKNN